MPKLRKQRKSQRFRYNVNRKRLRNKLENKGVIKDAELQKEWEVSKTVLQNVKNMGLCLDPNISLKIPNSKQAKLQFVKLVNGFIEEEDNEITNVPEIPKKQFVVQYLEKNANELRESKFELPKGQVKLLTYYMDKYGRNYKKMESDVKNYDQETWKQIRAKIVKFTKTKTQYGKYIDEKLAKNTNFDISKWEEYNSDSEI